MMYSPPRHTFSVSLTSSKLSVCIAAGRRRVGNETLIRRWRRRSARLREPCFGLMTSIFSSTGLIGVTSHSLADVTPPGNGNLVPDCVHESWGTFVLHAGWGGRIRTSTVCINSAASYQLDHAPIPNYLRNLVYHFRMGIFRSVSSGVSLNCESLLHTPHCFELVIRARLASRMTIAGVRSR